jgi:hypothetical protein
VSGGGGISVKASLVKANPTPRMTCGLRGDARTDAIEKWWCTADTAHDAGMNSWDKENS